jgi:hypothetical protein
VLRSARIGEVRLRKTARCRRAAGRRVGRPKMLSASKAEIGIGAHRDDAALG